MAKGIYTQGVAVLMKRAPFENGVGAPPRAVIRVFPDLARLPAALSAPGGASDS